MDCSVYLLPFAGVEERTDVAAHLEHLVAVKPQFHLIGLALGGVVNLSVGPHIVLRVVSHLVYQHYLVGTHATLALVGVLLIGTQSAVGSPDKPRGLSIQPCKSEKEEPYIRHSSQGRSECLYLRIE